MFSHAHIILINLRIVRLTLFTLISLKPLILFDHLKLLFKLKLYGIDDPLLEWIEIFLFSRTQCVFTDYCFLFVCNVVSGVPQGSVLGSILFLIYLNDLDFVYCGNSVLQLFEYDVKLHTPIPTSISNNTSASLQRPLDKLTQWANDWHLTIDISKYLMVSISVKSEPA
jgi:ribonuclease P/MRP protein subunit RPP40